MNRPIIRLAAALALLCFDTLGHAHAQTCKGPVTRVTGDRGYTILAAFPSNAIVDATGAIWRLSQYPAGRNLTPLRVSGKTNACLRGGSVIGDTPLEIGWGTRYARGNSAAIVVGAYNAAITSGTVVDGVRYHNVWDAMRAGPKARNTYLRGNHVTANYDDCIENDGKTTVIAEDNLLDGCFAAFSARNPDTTVAAGAVFTIRNNLVRLAPIPGWPKEAPSKGPAHAQIFKWESGSIPVRLTNNVFLLADGARTQFGSVYNPFAFPSTTFRLTDWNRYVRESTGNKIVWIGSGAYPFAVPPGFTVTTDKKVWENAKSDWLARHPAVARTV